jgi:ubiquinone/menaquinone biosynthesis C-methylase UbiE
MMSTPINNQLIDIGDVLARAQLRPGMRIADFGCSRTGHVVFRAAPLVGDRGMVFAVDILREALDAVNKRARLEGLSMVHPIWADVERVGKTAIPDHSLDCVFIINLLTHINEKEAVLTEAARLMKEKARLFVVDWLDSPLLHAFHRTEPVQFDQITAWCADHGFVLQEMFQPGKHHGGAVYFRQL